MHETARVQGKGFLQAKELGVNLEEARILLKKQTYFDYLAGRVMKVEIDGDTLDTYLYDRDNGQGAGERIINALR